MDAVHNKVRKDDAQWKKERTPMQCQKPRHAATEHPFTGALYDRAALGSCACGGCNMPLFESDTRFDSDCAGPSAFEASASASVREMADVSHGMRRTQALCNVCDAHLGPAFADGPPPTALRYGISPAFPRCDSK